MDYKKQIKTSSLHWRHTHIHTHWIKQKQLPKRLTGTHWPGRNNNVPVKNLNLLTDLTDIWYLHNQFRNTRADLLNVDYLEIVSTVLPADNRQITVPQVGLCKPNGKASDLHLIIESLGGEGFKTTLITTAQVPPQTYWIINLVWGYQSVLTSPAGDSQVH